MNMDMIEELEEKLKGLIKLGDYPSEEPVHMSDPPTYEEMDRWLNAQLKTAQGSYERPEGRADIVEAQIAVRLARKALIACEGKALSETDVEREVATEAMLRAWRHYALALDKVTVVKKRNRLSQPRGKSGPKKKQ
jgi:hypothetical protein